jgi:hypothetical protein
MAWMSCMGECIMCRRLFSFNPDLVPSVRVRGAREPICRDCVERANPHRIANKLEPIHILPGAYEPTEV